MLTIYKASAGSGKTFRLVAEYLKLVLKNEANYRHILAVTFTNKATAEMKGRVVYQLSQLAANVGNNPYASLISEETGLSPEEIKSRAKEALRNILYDYDRFSVSTIDKFTQKVIKAFNREIGISPGYTLELDNEALLQEATDRLILKAGNDKKLLKWLSELGNERIRDKKSFIFRTEIFNLGKELFNEKFQDYFISGQRGLYSRKSLKKYRKELQTIIRRFESELKEKGGQGLAVLSEYNLVATDFNYGNSGIIAAFQKAVNKSYSFGKRITEDSADPENWVKKGHQRRDYILTVVENRLLPLLQDILIYYNRNFGEYITALKVKANLFTLGLLNDLQEEIDNIRQEKGILPLSDSNLLLKKIIDGSDSPFIYEKTGNTFNHFMLDEFQDTSAMQWGNFKPLIDNSLAEGKSNLAVGDAKQSIYRWRNGDWNILANKIETQFDANQIQIKNLLNNWRSHSNIIGFNNLVFPQMAARLATKFDKEQGYDGQNESEATSLFRKIYNDVEQIIDDPEQREGGFVQVNFFEESEESGYKEQSLAQLLKQVKQLQDAGFLGKDIAILVRRNAEGGEIIRYFMEAAELPENRSCNLEIISNESLFLNSSNCVTLVVGLISHLVNPDDKITKATILNEYNSFLYPILSGKGKEVIYNREGYTMDGRLPGSLDPGYENEFEAVFAPVIRQLKSTILNASIDEVVTLICRAFNLFEIEGDLPFLLGLIDQAAQIKSGLSNDLSNFLKWWEDKGHKLSVSVNDETEAIRLMTIHKSKGLEFKVVLVPFFDWPVLWSHTPVLWCHPEAEPFNTLPLVPVKAVKDLAQSHFRKEYFEEFFNSYIDNLNLVYVAFTRAVSALYINAPFNEKDKSESSVAKVLYNSLAGISGSGTLDEPGRCFTIGELKGETTDRKAGEQVLPVGRYVFNEFSSRLKLRTNIEFFSGGELSDKNLGILVHEILSEIKTTADIDRSCQRALKQQKITQSEYYIITRWLRELVGSDQAKEWFSGRHKIVNERELLSPSGIKRPDRVMFSDGKAIVVDYKLGEPMPGKYGRQVTGYSSELKKIGFAEVEGYLWYLKPNIIEKVCSL